MKTPERAAPIEPSVEAVVTVRQRLHQMGFLLSDDAARDLLRDVLAVESARLDRRAREAATACLRSIQDAAQEVECHTPRGDRRTVSGGGRGAAFRSLGHSL